MYSAVLSVDEQKVLALLLQVDEPKVCVGGQSHGWGKPPTPPINVELEGIAHSFSMHSVTPI